MINLYILNKVRCSVFVRVTFGCIKNTSYPHILRKSINFLLYLNFHLVVINGLTLKSRFLVREEPGNAHFLNFPTTYPEN